MCEARLRSRAREISARAEDCMGWIGHGSCAVEDHAWHKLLEFGRCLNPLGGNGFRTDDGNRDRDRLEALLTAAGGHDDFIRIRAIGGCGTSVISPTAARARLGKGVRRCESQYGRN